MKGNSFAKAGVALLGGILALNGVVMMVAAEPWYRAIAASTGPFNAHFVRDIGAAYLAAAIALLWGMQRPAHRGPLAAIAGIFLGLHALTHLLEAATGVTSLGHVLEDFPGVHLPALVVIYLAAASLRRPAEA
jgi:hypothetical protein